MKTTQNTPDHLSQQLDASSSRYVVVEPDAGERLEFLGGSTMRLTHAEDGAEIAFYEYTSEPSVAGAPQHIHHGHDESFYVARGLFEFTIGESRATLAEGGFVLVPAGTPHAFRNCGDAPGRLVGTFSPAKFAAYFRELATVIRTTGAPPDRAYWVELYARYDTTFSPSDE